jgi:hypothetical protein
MIHMSLVHYNLHVSLTQTVLVFVAMLGLTKTQIVVFNLEIEASKMIQAERSKAK